MPVYTEVLLRTGASGTNYILDVYTQPLRQRLAARLYAKWWKVSQPLTMRLERPLYRRHERRCGGTCGFGVRRDTGERVQLCSYIPISCRQDCRLYELGHRRRHHIHETVVTSDTAEHFGWS